MSDTIRRYSSIRVESALLLLLAIVALQATVLARVTSKRPPVDPFQVETYSGCDGKPADVVFALDTSNSIWSRDFRQQMRFVRDVIQLFPVDAGIVRVALLTYADETTVHLRLGQHDRKSAIMGVIGKIRHVGGYGTRTADALRYMRAECFLRDSGSRTNVTRVGIVVTDGLSDDPIQTKIEAKRTREEGVHLFAVGVGKDRNLAELHSIASHPTSYYTILADSYGGLANIKHLLAIKTCSVTNPTPTSTVNRAMTSASVTETRDETSKGETFALSGTTAGNGELEIPERIGKGNDSRTGSSAATEGVDDGRRNQREPRSWNKHPGFWKLEKDGRMRRLLAEVKVGSENLPVISNGSEVSVDGSEISASNGQNGSDRVLVGKIINGSKFIGRWISEDIWWGYIIKETTDGKEDDTGSWPLGDVTTPSDNVNGSDEGGGEKVSEHLESGSEIVSSSDGFWLRHEAGRPIWYRYTRPGVYEPAMQEMALHKLKESSSDVTDADALIRKYTVSEKDQNAPSIDKSIEGCSPSLATDVVFAIDSYSKDEQVVRNMWTLVHDVISGVDNASLISIRFVHRCSELSRLTEDRYRLKDDLLKAVDAIRRTSTDLLEKMVDQQVRNADGVAQPRRQVGIFITDSRSANLTRSVEIADKAKHFHGVELVAVGFGSGVNPTELQAISSCPTENHYFLVDARLNSEDTRSASKEISQLLCDGLSQS